MPRWEWTLSSFNISLSLVSEVKRQRSVPEDLKRAAEERGALTETEGRKPTEDEVLKCIFKFSVSCSFVLMLSVTPGHSWTSNLHTVTHICLRAREVFLTLMSICSSLKLKRPAKLDCCSLIIVRLGKKEMDIVDIPWIYLPNPFNLS